MPVNKYIGNNLSAEAFKVITLYNKYKGGQQVRRLTTRGGVISKITEIKGVFEPVGDSYIMIGLQDEAGTSWTRYEPGVFNVNGIPLIISDKDVSELTEKDNPIKQGLNFAANFGKTALLVGGGIIALILIMKIRKK
jgi:hypothetical protein